MSTALVDSLVPRAAGSHRRPPALLVVAALATVVPLLFPVVYLLFGAVAGGGDWVGALAPGRLVELAANTILLGGLVVLGAVGLGFTVAWLTTRTTLRGARLWATLTSLPLVIPSYVLALVLLSGTGRQGVLSQMSQALGLGSLPIPRGLLGATLALVVSTFPYAALTLAPSLRRLDPALEESARALGASAGKRFRTVILPQVGPSLRSGVLLIALYALADFGAVSLLGYDTFTRAIFLQYAGRTDRTPATILAAVLVLIALVVILVSRPKRGEVIERRGRSVRPAPLIDLSRGQQALSQGFLTVLVLASVGVPLMVLLTWLVRGLRAGRETVSLVPELIRSMGLSLGTALLVAVVVIPLALLVSRYRSRVGSVLAGTVWTISALPHLTVGLAVLLLGVSLLLPLYQSVWLLLLGYLMMFLPQSLGPTEAALLAVSPNLEEASRSLGWSGSETFRRVTLPLIGRGVLAGAGLVFLTTMKELPATLILRPTGFETLAIRIWSTTGEGLYTRAALASLVLIAVAAAPLYLLRGRMVA